MTVISSEKRSHFTEIICKFLPLAALALFFIIILRRAWLSDDAYITFRTVDNFINGYRLTWNVSERVQSYTHPLWMLTLSLFYFITNEIYLTSIFLSLFISILAVVVFTTRVAPSRLSATIAVVVLSLSNAFVDYSTSGLENPLSHLLFAAFLYIFLISPNSPRKLFGLSLVASLAAVNRMDLFLLYAPALAYSFWVNRSWRNFWLMAAGQVPFLLWEGFSIFYYGFPFPNTAYAKLNTHIPTLDLAVRGLRYLLFSLRSDPVTLIVIASALIWSVIRRETRSMLLAAGIVLYLLYVIKIGGDFMSGRYFTTIFFASVAILAVSAYGRISSRVAVGFFAALLILGVSIVNPTWKMYNSNAFLSYQGVVDERLWYFPDAGLLRNGRFNTAPDTLGRTGGMEARQKSYEDFYVTAVNSIGVYGYYAGPKVHIIDRWALSDPLLARIPPERQVRWVIGHLMRIIPKGYVTSIYTGHPSLEDPNLSLYYEKLALITRGPLFDPQRLIEIVRMNLGMYNSLIDDDAYRLPELVKVSSAQVSTPLPDGAAWDSPSAVQFGDHGVQVQLDDLSHAAVLTLSLRAGDTYQIIFRSSGKEISALEIRPEGRPSSSLETVRVTVPPSANAVGFDQVRILPLTGLSHYSLGYLFLSK